MPEEHASYLLNELPPAELFRNNPVANAKPITCPVCRQEVDPTTLPPELRSRLIVGLRLTALRNARCLTQEEVAHEIGCSRVMVTLIEMGQRGLSLKRALQFARLYGISLEALTAGME
jgi:DNA-binding XRE family transcriptional regulator